MNISKKITVLLAFFLFVLSYSQSDKKDGLIADFTYLLKGKINKSTPDYVHEEFFSLQVLNDKAFFISEKALKFDSIFRSEFQKSTLGTAQSTDFRNKSFPRTKFPYTIIQSNQNIQYFERVGMTLLSYKETPVNNWKLVDESKIINSFSCKKAEISYKGRNWTAWYSTEIPLSYGPYKFSGLPGLIIKISDQKGDYDFELVKSLSVNSLKDRVLSISKLRYDNAKVTTLAELKTAKKNFSTNMVGSLESMGTNIAPEQRENFRNMQKQKQQNMLDENSIELL